MMGMAAALLWLLCAPGLADEGLDGEARRLSLEMETLASRNAWDGVERMYEELIALGSPPPREAHLLAAEAAKSSGDIFAAVDRLERAHQAEHSADTEAAIKTLLDEYGRASLNCKAGHEAITAEVEPFRPDFKQAIAFANAELQRTGHFRGFLPAGGYAFGDETFAVRPHTSPEHIDLTGVPKLDFEIPKKVKLGKSKVALNGVGVHVHDYTDMYVAALYLSTPSSEADLIVDTDEPQRIWMHVVFRNLTHAELAAQFREGMTDAAIQPQVQQFASMLEPVKKGDELSFDWDPAQQAVVVTVKGNEKGRVQGEAFRAALWRVFLGEAADARLRHGLLHGD